MPQVYISTFGGVAAQFFSANGVPLVGGKIYSYLAGTTTPAAVYTSSSGVTTHTNPIILDSAGRVPGGEIWQPSGANYKFSLYTSDDVLIATYDNVATIAAGVATVNNFTGDGAQVSFTLTATPLNENATTVFVNGIYQQKNTYSVVGSALVFSEAPPDTSTIEIMYF